MAFCTLSRFAKSAPDQQAKGDQRSTLPVGAHPGRIAPATRAHVRDKSPRFVIRFVVGRIKRSPSGLSPSTNQARRTKEATPDIRTARDSDRVDVQRNSKKKKKGGRRHRLFFFHLRKRWALSTSWRFPSRRPTFARFTSRGTCTRKKSTGASRKRGRRAHVGDANGTPAAKPASASTNSAARIATSTNEDIVCGFCLGLLSIEAPPSRVLCPFHFSFRRLFFFFPFSLGIRHCGTQARLFYSLIRSRRQQTRRPTLEFCLDSNCGLPMQRGGRSQKHRIKREPTPSSMRVFCHKICRVVVPQSQEGRIIVHFMLHAVLRLFRKETHLCVRARCKKADRPYPPERSRSDRLFSVSAVGPRLVALASFATAKRLAKRFFCLASPEPRGMGQ